METPYAENLSIMGEIMTFPEELTKPILEDFGSQQIAPEQLTEALQDVLDTIKLASTSEKNITE